MGKPCSQNEEGRKAFNTLTGKSTGKRLLGRPRRRWEDNIRMGPKEIGFNTRNCVDSAQKIHYWRALVNTALNLRVSIHHIYNCIYVTVLS